MVSAIIIGLLGLLILGFGYKKQKEKERAAEVRFRATMLALEEKAKREGTFKKSYFDGEEK